MIAMPKFKQMQKLVDNVNLVSREILTGLSVIRAFGREKKEEERRRKEKEGIRKKERKEESAHGSLEGF